MAQDIVIDNTSGAGGTGTVVSDVWGNGTGADGTPVTPPDNATSNSVTVNNGGRVVGVAHGGHAESASAVTAASNSVTVNSGGRVDTRVQGGYAYSTGATATATGNNVIIDGGTVNGTVQGGVAYSDSAAATATGNSVTINGGTVNGAVYGGFASTSGTPTATNNSVTINGSSTITGNLYGGSGSGIGDVFTGNTLNKNSDAGVSGIVQNFEIINFGYSGNANISTLGTTPTGAPGSPLVKLNTDVNNVTFGGVISGTGGIDKTGSGTLTLSGANTYSGGTTVTAGTLAGNTTSLRGAITNNANVEFNQTGAGTYTGIMSGSGSLTKTGAGTLTLSGTNNYGATNINGGTLSIASDANIGNGTNTLNGGTLALTSASIYTKGWTLSGTANNIATDTTTILNGILSGTGGFAKTGTGTLTLGGANDFTGPLAINSGTLALRSTGSLATSSMSMGGNTIFDYSQANAYAGSSPAALKNLTINGVGAQITPNGGGADFSNGILNFNVPSTANAGDTILTVNGDAIVTNATVNLDTPSGRPNVTVGQNLTLLDVSGTLTGATTMIVQTSSGDIYTIQLDGTQQLLAILEKLAPTGPAYERLKAYAEGRAASLAFANQGQDFILNRGFGSALAATSGEGYRFGFLGGIGGGWSRYTTGSHVDVSGTSLLAGMALGNDIAYGRLTLGAFFEGGWGNYTSHNSFSNAASVKGDGDTSYLGGGVLGRYDVTSGTLSGFYADASGRIGHSKMDFKTDDIQYNGNKAKFDSDALYYGLHGGLGYVCNLTDRAAFDFSAKFLWTRLEGDSRTVYQDRVKFEDADSLRIRLGGRFNYTVNEYITPYAGAYWEHEFDGQSRSTVNGNRIDTVSLRGDTGMGELGFTARPLQKLPLSIDLGVQGYAGKREGAAGSLQIKFEF